MIRTYLILFLAIIFETFATSCLKQTGQFTRLIPSILTLVGYGGSFYFLSIVLKVLPVGIAYAIWSATGIVLVAGIGYVVFGQRLDLPAIIGIVLIISGVIVINLFSNSTPH